MIPLTVLQPKFPVEYVVDPHMERVSESDNGRVDTSVTRVGVGCQKLQTPQSDSDDDIPGDKAAGALDWRNFAECTGVEAPTCRTSASSMETWDLCPRKFFWRHRVRLVPKGVKPQKSLDLGKMFHILMAYYYNDESEGAAVAAIGAYIDEWVEAVRAEGHDKADTYAAQWEQDLVIARAMFQCFIGVYPKEPRYKTLLVERELEITQQCHSRPIVAIIDRALLDTEKNEVWLVDHKTASKPMTRVKTVGWDDQVLLYRFVLQQHFPQYKVVGFLHNVIRPPTIKLCDADRDYQDVEFTPKSGKNKGVTRIERQYFGPPKFSNYVKRVRDQYLATGDYVDTLPQLQLDPPILQSWYRYPDDNTLPGEFAVKLHEVGRACGVKPRITAFYRVRTACDAYNRECEYMPLCQSNHRLWKQIIADNYTVRKERVTHDE